MIVTFQTMVLNRLTLLRRGQDVRIDLGSVLIEMDPEELKRFVADLHEQAAREEIYLPTLK